MALFALLLQQQDTLQLTVTAEYGGRLVGMLFAGQTEQRLAWLCDTSSEYHQHRVSVFDVNHIVALVICGIKSAYEQLATLPSSTQRRYRLRIKQQARGRRGRPIKLSRTADASSTLGLQTP